MSCAPIGLSPGSSSPMWMPPVLQPPPRRITVPLGDRVKRLGGAPEPRPTVLAVFGCSTRRSRSRLETIRAPGGAPTDTEGKAHFHHPTGLHHLDELTPNIGLRGGSAR